FHRNLLHSFDWCQLRQILIKLVVRLLTENLKSHNSFLWRQLTAPGPSPNTSFLSPGCPHSSHDWLACKQLQRNSVALSARPICVLKLHNLTQTVLEDDR